MSISSHQLSQRPGFAHPTVDAGDWQQGEDVIIAGSVSDEEAKQTYPEGWKAPRPYIRIVPRPR